jgi:hypothetical protein
LFNPKVPVDIAWFGPMARMQELIAKRLFENYLFYPISALSEEFNPQNSMRIS